jgi:hypothetical protein
LIVWPVMTPAFVRVTWAASLSIVRAIWTIKTLAAFEAPACPRPAGAQFFAGQFSVFVPIQFAKRGGSAIDLGFIENTVMIRIQRGDQRRSETAWAAFGTITSIHPLPVLKTLSALSAFGMFGAPRAFGAFRPFWSLHAVRESAALRPFGAIAVLEHSRAAPLGSIRPTV